LPCNAGSDIKTQVAALQGLTPAPASVDPAKTALKKIGDDLTTISASAPKVKGSLKPQLQTADATFQSQVTQVTKSITSAQSLHGCSHRDSERGRGVGSELSARLQQRQMVKTCSGVADSADRCGLQVADLGAPENSLHRRRDHPRRLVPRGN
jgi:hypothetical protein